MADFESFARKLLALEGGYVNNPNDKGGPTKYGVILSSWRQYGYDKNKDGKIDAEDIKLLTQEDAKRIAKKVFWDYFKADSIKNQSIAELIVDWGYNSGRTLATRKVQQLLGLKADGLFGESTLHAINKISSQHLFDKIKAARKTFYEQIIKHNPSQKIFYRGWMNRLEKISFLDHPPEGLGLRRG